MIICWLAWFCHCMVVFRSWQWGWVHGSHEAICLLEAMKLELNHLNWKIFLWKTKDSLIEALKVDQYRISGDIFRFWFSKEFVTWKISFFCCEHIFISIQFHTARHEWWVIIILHNVDCYLFRIAWIQLAFIMYSGINRELVIS